MTGTIEKQNKDGSLRLISIPTGWILEDSKTGEVIDETNDYLVRNGWVSKYKLSRNVGQFWYKEDDVMSGYKRNADSINTIFNKRDSEKEFTKNRRMIRSAIGSEVWNVSPTSKELYNICDDLDFKLVNPGRHFHKKYTFNSTKGEPSAECSIYVYPDNYSIAIRQAKWAPNDYDKWVDKLINVMNNLGLNFKKISMGGSAYNYEAEYTGSDIVDSLKSVTNELNSINPNELRYSSDLNPFSEGYNAYMKNNPTCPYKQGTPEFDGWIDGWQEAEMDMES